MTDFNDRINNDEYDSVNSAQPTGDNMTDTVDENNSAAQNTAVEATEVTAEQPMTENADVQSTGYVSDDTQPLYTQSSQDFQNSGFENNTYSGADDTQPQSFAQPIQNDGNLAHDITCISGGYDGQNVHPCFTENVKKKHKNRKKGFIAAALAITVLNLSIMGGMFYMGNRLGRTGRSVASKQELMDSLKSSDSSNGDTSGATQTVATGNELSTTEIAKKVGPAVVGIKSTMQGQMTIFGSTQASQAEGSGIIISEDGYIVTNNHVVDGATAISVQLNTGTELDAKLIGKDSQTDLAVIKIEPTEQLTVATIGDSTKIEVGERVVAIGNPMGLEFFGTVTQGIVSGVNRTITVDNRTMNVIQTDAAINSGNSGGALINRFGEVIGINSVKVSSSGVEGMGFAIPSSEAKPIISDLLEHGYVKGRPVIGISTRDVTEYMARTYSWPQGVQVMEVTSENAKNAGFAQGDIITEVDGEKVTDTESLNKIKNNHNPGDVLKMTVYKYASGKTETVEVTLSEQLPN